MDYIKNGPSPGSEGPPLAGLQEGSPHSSANDYLQVPDAMRQDDRWINHRADKVPCDKNGNPIDATNPYNWLLFEVALANVRESGGKLGLGFALGDGWQGIDLDNVEVNGTQPLANLLLGYREYSPSGRGCHAIGKGGSFPTLKLKGIEAYSHGRYFTVTGNAIGGEICDLAPFVAAHLEPLRPRPTANAPVEPPRSPTEATSGPETESDEVILARAKGAGNGAKFTRLWEGRWQGHYTSQSEADFALVDILAFYSKNDAQVVRLFRQSALGQRDKAKRDNYLNYMLAKARDREVRPYDFTGLTANGRPVAIGVVEQQPIQSEPPHGPTLTDAGDWEGVTLQPREWVVVNRFPERHVTLMHSPGGGGKSLAAQQLLTSSALGCKWFGEWVSPGIGLIVNCEDFEAEALRRQRDLNAHLGQPISALKGRLYFLTLTGNPDNSLVRFVNGTMVLTDLFQQIKLLVLERGITRVVFDNASNLFPGNENARNEVAPFIGALEGLASETGAAIILIAHDNKMGQSSGSTAWFNQVRMVLKLETLGNGVRRLSVEKSNYGPTGKPIECVWHNGVFKTEAELPADFTSEMAANEQARLEDGAFLECLAKLTEQNRTVSPHRNAQNYAPKVFAEIRAFKSLGKAGFEAALNRLLNSGVIANEQPVYQRSNRTWATGLAPAQKPAQNPAQSLHESCTQAAIFASEEGAQNCTAQTPIYKYIDGKSQKGSLPIKQEQGEEAWPDFTRH